MLGIICLGMVLYLLALLALLVSTLWTHRHFRAGPPHLDAPFGLYPVSILKPLKGADPGLRENLISFFRLDYPEYELLFSVESVFDPAYAIVEELIARFPHVRARVSVGLVQAGINPKINNLVKIYDQSNYDLVLISDSNVRVSPDMLKRLVAHLETGVGIVTSVVAGTDGRGVGAELESMFLNTFYSRWMILSARLGRPCVVGKSMLFGKSTARRFGGIQALGNYLAEDFMAGEAMRRLGLRIVVASDPVRQIVGSQRVSEFWNRHLRWGRIRKAQAPLAFFLEPWMGSVLSGMMGAFCIHQLFGVAPATLMAIHLGLWSACDVWSTRALGRELSPSWPWVWLSRECLALPLWGHILVGRTVIWRGQRLTLEAGGLLKA